MNFKERFLTTGIGSLPYLDAEGSVKTICSGFDIPFWPQLPKRGFKENMYVQFAEGLPSLIIDEEDRKVYIDTSKDLSEGLGRIYEAYLAEDYEAFAVKRTFAEGLYTFINLIKGFNPYYVKGQVTGPVSFGLSIVDHKGKSIIYDDTLREAAIKLLEIKSLYQINKLKAVCKNVIIFIDEPYLVSFGSSFVNLEKIDVVRMLNVLIEKIHSKGALCGIHCCGNTDWSMLVETETDIVNFDAYSYAEALSLYPQQITGFLKKGGYLAWGIIPTSERVLTETTHSLLDKLSSEIARLVKKGIPSDLLRQRSLITPSCGMGTLSQEISDDIIRKIPVVARLAKDMLG